VTKGNQDAEKQYHSAKSDTSRAKTVRERAQAIITDQRYDLDTRNAILGALQDNAPELAALVQRADPRADARPHAVAELAAHISAVLTHPLTPQYIYDELWNAVNELATPESFYDTASYIEGRLSGLVELPQEGGGN